MRLAFRIALRFLTSNKGQTILIALGIGIGISVQIFIGSLIQGLQISLVDATIGQASHITIQSSVKNEPIVDYIDIENKTMQGYEGITAISPTLTRGAFLLFDNEFEQVLFRGFEMNKANTIYRFDKALVEGRFPKANEVMLGELLAKENKINVFDTIEILTPDGLLTEVVVSGLFDLKVAAINNSWVVGELDLAREIFEYEDDAVSALEMQIKEPFNATEATEKISQAINNKSIALSNWKEANEQLLSGLNGQSTSSLMIQVFVVISVVLGIASVLAITVLQKSKQIGILKAMGINDKNASLVFIFQGLMLGMVGGIVGILLGLVLLWSFSTFALNADGTPVVPIFINIRFIGLSGFIAISASTVASVLPALKSKKLSPIEVIRNG
ncbi:lipoprotein-releasing system permease protein [Natranaerovirga pectinivora]|uniref:Lipoprotein-releasing system permease protein n=1 Tax=Natranaerovirga pectinivora TaxID=682400 RepID=A0A4R3MP64_9FIRM|nr:FtsX-like permease family protein [Natranaerovirga pectinivora]TCT16051.1 lipoprotein-releasing system permease protein [Natranaerovirga pectinivora]